jgi:hypothetical protein
VRWSRAHPPPIAQTTARGFHGRTGFVASWRPIHPSSRAIKVGGSPFETLTEAEEACKAMLGHLKRKLDGE